MRYGLALFWLRLKAGVRSAFFWGMVVLFTGLAFAFCSLLPQRPQINVSVGLLVDTDPVSRAAAERLLKNVDYRFLLYQEEMVLTRGVLTGELHCAYRITAGQERPVTLYAAESSYMTPIVNEVVLAAYLEAAAPTLAAEFLAGEGRPSPTDLEAYFADLQERSRPMTVELSSPEGGDWAARYGDSGMQTLLYAVLGALLPAAALLRATLRGGEENRLGGTFRYPRGHAAATALVPLAVEAVLGTVALLVADGVIAVLYAAPAYTWPARVAAMGALALITALCAALALPLARHPAVLLALPVVLAFWVLFSGAVLDPRLLPNGLGTLRWLSPPWYFLRLMAFLSI